MLAPQPTLKLEDHPFQLSVNNYVKHLLLSTSRDRLLHLQYHEGCAVVTGADLTQRLPNKTSRYSEMKRVYVDLKVEIPTA